MNARVLPLICDPESHEALQLEGDALVNLRSGRRFPISEGIPIFLDAVSGLNKKYQDLYERIARFYDPTLKLYGWLSPKRDWRTAYMDELEVSAGGRVLQVSVGTGGNLPYFRSDIDFFGLDLTWGMLRQCKKSLRKWNRSAERFQGEAERLPFRDEVFDTVFHVGGINFFNDKAGSIREMIRVAKPGTKILIVDETERVVRSNYERMPLLRRYFRGRTEAVTDPTKLVPGEMLEVRLQELFTGKIYCLTFRKPRGDR